MKRLVFSLLVFSLSGSLYAADGASGPVLTPYGFFLGGVEVSSRSVDSFGGNSNLSAPTSVSAPGLAKGDEPVRSFQVAQSRIGLLATPSKESRVSGQAEFDFIDFTKSSPTTTTVPRLRIAKISFKAGQNDLIELGQDWDVFSPGKPYTYNFVGLYFNAGNVGFMRQQAKWKHTFGSVDVIGAVGMPAINKGATVNDVERSLIPSGSLQVAAHLSDQTVVGVSGIGGPDQEPYGKHAFYGANAFYALTVPSGVSISVEGYYGQNLGNSGALALATGDATAQTLHEAGGYVTLACPVAGPVTGFGGVGFAGIFEKLGDGGPSAVAGERRKNNGKVELGATVDLAEHLKFYAQESVFRTGFINAVTLAHSNPVAAVTSGGLQYTF